MKLSQAAQLLQTKPITTDVEFHGVSTDTRTIQPGNLFIAIKGPHFDGHDFIAQAIAKNAAAIMLERPCNSSPLPYLQVENTIKAMGELAAHQRAQFNIPVIGLTGSCGKTTTRALIASILSEAGETLFSESSYNNEIGVPLTLLRLEKKHQYAVIEMGANHFGEIAYLTHIVKPTLALITNAAAGHLEGFGSIDGVCKAKGEIFQGLSHDGTGILNADDPHFSDWEKILMPRKLISFSLDKPAPIHAKQITIDADGKPHFILVTPSSQINIDLPLLGHHNVANALAAAAAAYVLNIPLSTIKSGLEKASAVTRRLKHYTAENGAYLIDDSYNANPLSVAAAINILAQRPGEKILVLGDMRELGEQTATAHREIGKKALEAGIDHLYTYGNSDNASVLATQTFGDRAQHFTDQTALIALLKTSLLPSMSVLVKGSLSMKMDRVVKALINTDK